MYKPALIALAVFTYNKNISAWWCCVQCFATVLNSEFRITINEGQGKGKEGEGRGARNTGFFQ